MDTETDAFDDPLNPVFSPRKAITTSSSLTHTTPSKFQQSAAWFDIRVFYVRVSSCCLEDAPDVLTMHYLPKSPNTSIEVNGVRICRSVHPFLILKRDRMDTESVEITYVSTDNLRTNGEMSFEIVDKDDLLICGSLKKTGLAIPHGLDFTSPSKQCQDEYLQVVSSQHGWKMECTCVMGSSKCSFTRNRPMFSAVTCPPPCVEVYLAGRVSCLPVVLTETVKLIARRKYLRPETMNTIPEEENELFLDSPAVDKLSQGPERCQAFLYTGVIDGRQMEWDDFCAYEGQGSFCAEHNGFCRSHEYTYLGDGEEGDLSWFKAGLRVGVGIGLGICLGLGIGVGVFVRAYQSTTRTLNSRAFRRKIL